MSDISVTRYINGSSTIPASIANLAGTPTISSSYNVPNQRFTLSGSTTLDANYAIFNKWQWEISYISTNFVPAIFVGSSTLLEFIAVQNNVDSIDGGTVSAYYIGTTKTLTFNPNGGTVAFSQSAVTNFNKLTNAFPTATRTGFFLNGWGTAPTGGNIYNSDSYAAFSVATTLYPQWAYYINYNSDGSRIWRDARAIQQSAIVTSSVPTKSGSTFAGWYSNSALTGSSYWSGAAFDRSTLGELSLYAKWTSASYVVASSISLSVQYAPQNETVNISATPTSATISIPVHSAYGSNGYLNCTKLSYSSQEIYVPTPAFSSAQTITLTKSGTTLDCVCGSFSSAMQVPSNQAFSVIVTPCCKLSSSTFLGSSQTIQLGSSDPMIKTATIINPTPSAILYAPTSSAITTNVCMKVALDLNNASSWSGYTLSIGSNTYSLSGTSSVYDYYLNMRNVNLSANNNFTVQLLDSNNQEIASTSAQIAVNIEQIPDYTDIQAGNIVSPTSIVKLMNQLKNTLERYREILSSSAIYADYQDVIDSLDNVEDEIAVGNTIIDNNGVDGSFYPIMKKVAEIVQDYLWDVWEYHESNTYDLTNCLPKEWDQVGLSEYPTYQSNMQIIADEIVAPPFDSIDLAINNNYQKAILYILTYIL